MEGGRRENGGRRWCEAGGGCERRLEGGRRRDNGGRRTEVEEKRDIEEVRGERGEGRGGKEVVHTRDRETDRQLR